MARASYSETICAIAPDGTMKAVGNIEVTVRDAFTDALVDLWNHPTDNAPANEIDNPFLTAPSGLVEWHGEGTKWKISVHDTEGQPRIADRTYYIDGVPGDINPADLGFAAGDLKLSANDADHGRWLKCDGRELTQAEIEGALSLAAGEGSDIVAFLGTGAASKYDEGDTTAGGKVKIPNSQGRIPIGTDPTGAGGGLSARPLGQRSGVENVTLTGAQSGIKAHNHSASQDAHGHPINDPGHGHDVTRDGAFNIFGAIQHASGITGGGAIRLGYGAFPTPAMKSDASTTGISTASVQPGVTVDNKPAEAASDSHTNMPPTISLGYWFIRV